VVSVHSLASAPSSTVNFTMTSDRSDETAIRCWILEFNASDIASTSWVAASAGNSGLGSSVDPGTVTTQGFNRLLLVVGGTDSDLLGWTSPSGLTWLNPDVNENHEPGQKHSVAGGLATSPGIYSGAYSIRPDLWSAVIIAYRPGGSSDTIELAPPTDVLVQ
jgi:hypothetical protein